jgi:hypothetical protein
MHGTFWTAPAHNRHLHYRNASRPEMGGRRRRWARRRRGLGVRQRWMERSEWWAASGGRRSQNHRQRKPPNQPDLMSATTKPTTKIECICIVRHTVFAATRATACQTGPSSSQRIRRAGLGWVGLGLNPLRQVRFQKLPTPTLTLNGDDRAPGSGPNYSLTQLLPHEYRMPVQMNKNPCSQPDSLLQMHMSVMYRDKNIV